jgi:acyl carrier protein
VTTDSGVFAELETIIRASAGEFGAGMTVTPQSTFNDLGMESLDIVALAGRIQAHYGWAVNFAEFLGASDVTTILDTHIQDLVDYIDDSLAPAGEGSR